MTANKGKLNQTAQKVLPDQYLNSLYLLCITGHKDLPMDFAQPCFFVFFLILNTSDPLLSVTTACSKQSKDFW